MTGAPGSELRRFDTFEERYEVFDSVVELVNLHLVLIATSIKRFIDLHCGNKSVIKSSFETMVVT